MRIALLLAAGAAAFAADLPVERGGLLRVEAEDFDRQSLTEIRRWVRISNGAHTADAGGGAYVEVQPDTRATHDDELIHGENFSNEPGKMAVLEYDVEIRTPGRYYVWVRSYSTGTEDNGIHVGLDGAWPESGQRMQWCEGKNAWTWASKQRTAEEHCGVPGLIFLDIDLPGRHTVTFSMREDGFEMDAWELARDSDYLPAP